MSLMSCSLLLGGVACSQTDTSSSVIGLADVSQRGVPNDYQQFQPAIAECKLQISDPNGKPGNITNAAKQGHFDGFMNEHFYVDKTDNALVFSMYGVKKRSELRFMNNFKTSEPDTFYHLSASVKPIEPDKSVAQSDFKLDEITYMQVHNSTVLSDGKSQFPHPLLRVVWHKERGGIVNHYWATVKSNTLICKGVDSDPSNPDCNSKKSYSFYDLGAWTAGETTDFEVIVGNNRLVVKRDGETKFEKDISYWKDQSSYFKAGVYNQFSRGTSVAKFYKLNYWIEHQ